MTPFAMLLSLSGLSKQEAADFLGVRLDTIKSWVSDRRTVPDKVIDQMRGLIALQKRQAQRLLELIAEKSHAGDEIELSLARDDAEAKAPPLGWPARSAQAMSIAHVIAALPGRKIIIVDRDQTAASSAAVARHEAKR